jgi:putative MATE family efflux protein
LNPEQTIAERWNNRALFGLLWPLIIEQILTVAIGAVDTIMVSSVGEFAVSAVNIIDNINNLLIIAFTAMCTGGAVVVSQYIGRRDPANSRIATKQLIYCVTVISLVIMAIALLLHRPIIRLLYGVLEQDVMDASATYFFITAMSYPFLAVFNANAALFRAVGNSRVTMRIAILINVLNVIGNACFIYGLKLGVMGAALCTLTCRIIAAAITVGMLTHNAASPISLVGVLKIKFVRPMIKNILNVGIPSGLESSMFMVGRILTQRIFPIFGTAAIAGNAITSVINSFSFMIGNAFGIALLTVVGQCVGARDYTAAKKQTLKIMKLAYITLLILSTFVFIFSKHLIGLFNLSPEAAAMAHSFLSIHCISMAFGWAVSFALPNALRAAGDARFVMLAAVISMWLVRVSAAYLLTFTLGFGPLGVWLAMGADFVVRGTFYCTRWIRGKWQGKRVISE